MTFDAHWVATRSHSRELDEQQKEETRNASPTLWKLQGGVGGGRVSRFPLKIQWKRTFYEGVSLLSPIKKQGSFNGVNKIITKYLDEERYLLTGTVWLWASIKKPNHTKPSFSFWLLLMAGHLQSHGLFWDSLASSLLQVPFCVQDLNWSCKETDSQWHMDSLQNKT